jgi:hypothetical protein
MQLEKSFVISRKDAKFAKLLYRVFAQSGNPWSVEPIIPFRDHNEKTNVYEIWAEDN